MNVTTELLIKGGLLNLGVYDFPVKMDFLVIVNKSDLTETSSSLGSDCNCLVDSLSPKGAPVNLGV